jgi:hypothetical protein
MTVFTSFRTRASGSDPESILNAFNVKLGSGSRLVGSSGMTPVMNRIVLGGLVRITIF